MREYGTWRQIEEDQGEMNERKWLFFFIWVISKSFELLSNLLSLVNESGCKWGFRGLMVRRKQGFATWPVCSIRCDTCQRSSATGSTEQLEAANLHIRDICIKKRKCNDWFSHWNELLSEVSQLNWLLKCLQKEHAPLHLRNLRPAPKAHLVIMSL